MVTDNPAALIAMDLATAIHQQLIRPGERMPTQTELMKAYGVAMGTVAAALRKLREHGLTRSEAGRGVFAAGGFRPDPPGEYAVERPVGGEVASLFEAASTCRYLAAQTVPAGTTPTITQTAYDHDEAREAVIRTVDASALAGLDRRMLRALGDAFAAAARRVVGYGLAEIDWHLLTVANVILANGGHREAGQPPIAVHPGTPIQDENVAERIWPGRAARLSEDGAPF